MSGENIETAGREIMEALGRAAAEVASGKPGQDLSRLIALSHPEVEWRSLFAQLGAGGVYYGHEGIRASVTEVVEAFEFLRVDVDDGLGIGDIAVLVGRLHYRGKGSGVENESPTGWVLKFREGKLIYFRAFREPAQAFETVGLTEKKLSQEKLDESEKLPDHS